ncbi:MAG: triose-phosphate isomerase, partial [Oscillospiraceae bacterium]|nr:triose-phosphate isomerase [Oscillospiraceae bacterium]
MRTPVIAGNWKMNKTPDEAVRLINELKPLVAGARATVVVCPPYACLAAAKGALEGSNIRLGAQNLDYHDSCAYTGEISADMLKALGVEYVIIGHSERRQYYNETDGSVNLKVRQALKSGLIPIMCVGELLEEREQGVTAEIVSMQTKL